MVHYFLSPMDDNPRWWISHSITHTHSINSLIKSLWPLFYFPPLYFDPMQRKMRYLPKFSPPHTSIIKSYLPSSSNQAFEMVNKPPAIIGVLQRQQNQQQDWLVNHYQVRLQTLHF